MRILVADDSELIRRGIIRLLSQQEGWEVCGQATDAREAIEKTAQLHPDLVLLDVSMPGGSGLEITPVLKENSPQVKVLIISHHEYEQMLPRSLEVGASGCVDKARIVTDLLPAIRALQSASVDGAGG
jgi:DNA-binding NarL/FixJ family response regulator